MIFLTWFQDSAETLDELKLVINFVYILLGMGIVAMCYYLLKEDVNAKVEQFGRKVNHKCDQCRTKVGLWKGWPLCPKGQSQVQPVSDFEKVEQFFGKVNHKCDQFWT
jgi:hypothetical protein